ncbi:hypothetical protein ACP8Y2_24160 [Herpetosiphon llansteffanensis]
MIACLAAHFRVNRSTVFHWIQRDHPKDCSSAPKRHGRIVVTDAYRDTNPHHGTQQIAHELQAQFPTANKATIWRILHAAGRIGPRHQKTPSKADSRWVASRPVLPAIQGQHAREDTISVIDLRIQMKYSEIHPTQTSAVLAGVLAQAVTRVPPCYLVVSDNGGYRPSPTGHGV